METLVYINPLKPGKVEAYKAFCAGNNGPRKAECLDLLNRYGLKTAEAYFHKIGDVDFVVVVHIIEDDARERLTHFGTSTHPMDKWFVEQLEELHDLAPLNGASQEATPIFSYNPFLKR